jgi:hypothetical protein
MALFTEADIVELVPDILEFGIQDFSDDIARTEEDIYRLLRIQWWEPVARRGGDMDTTKLDPTELKRSCVYHCLAYFIFPKLSKFEVDGDRFKEMMDYYKARFDEEFNLAIRELHYDWDSSGTYEDSEIVHNESRRLVR